MQRSIRGFVAVILTIFLVGIVDAYEEVSVKDGATVTGKVIFKGTAPEPMKILISKNPEVCGTGYREIEWVSVADGGALTGVVIFLDGIQKGKAFSKPDSGSLLNQKGCTFLPYLQVMKQSEEITVLNSDPVLHNIHTYEVIGTVKRTFFNVAQPEQGSKFSKEIKPRRGHVIKIECDAHDFMHGWMYVIDHPYYTVVGKDGNFTIDNIPPGTYKVKAWHPTLGEREASVTLAAQGKGEVVFEFSGK